MKTNFKRFIFTWIILFLLVELIMSFFGIGKKDTAKQQEITDGVLIETMKDEISMGKEVLLNIENGKSEPITINQSKCVPPFEIFRYKAGLWEKVEAVKANCTEDTEGTDDTKEKLPPIILAPGEKGKYSLLAWNYELFSELGRYKVVLNLDKEYSSPEFTIKKKGILKRGWEAVFHKPIYNTLIFLTNISPYRSLGLGIILLTLIIRLILLIPSQKALKSQKRMQEIQPKIQEIQNKYKGNQERIALETMALWKGAKVNPLGSCLPILLQFPVLIALYYTVREVAMGGSVYNLYAFQADFDFTSIDTMFLGVLDLATKNLIALPVIVGLLQFIQMKLTFSLRKPKQKVESKPTNGMPDMQAMNKTMTYTMPLMIAFFTASLPAGVGLYWGVSTLFGIGQTVVVNREKPEDSSKTNSGEVTVKVIERTDEEKREEEKQKYLPGKKNK